MSGHGQVGMLSHPDLCYCVWWALGEIGQVCGTSVPAGPSDGGPREVAWVCDLALTFA